MAPSRSRKAPTSSESPAAPAAPPAPPPAPPSTGALPAASPAGVWSKLLAFCREHPVETLVGLSAAGTALLAVVGGLGLVALRAREALLGLFPGLAYSKQEWLLTGFDALASLFWRGLGTLVAGRPELRWGAWVLLGLTVALGFAQRTARRRPTLFLAGLALSALLLGIGGGLYRVALAAAPVGFRAGQGFDCGQRLSRNLADRAAFETCSWLINDAPANDDHRRDLAGLLGWLLAASLAAAWNGGRARGLGRWASRVRWALVGFHVLFVLLLVRDLPRAHAIASWGLRYPQVALQKPCDEELVLATATAGCWAFDVSAGAERAVVFLAGAGCPAGRSGGFAHLGGTTDGRECLFTLSTPPRVISYGPSL